MTSVASYEFQLTIGFILFYYINGMDTHSPIALDLELSSDLIKLVKPRQNDASRKKRRAAVERRREQPKGFREEAPRRRQDEQQTSPPTHHHHLGKHVYYRNGEAVTKEEYMESVQANRIPQYKDPNYGTNTQLALENGANGRRARSDRPEVGGDGRGSTDDRRGKNGRDERYTPRRESARRREPERRRGQSSRDAYDRRAPSSSPRDGGKLYKEFEHLWGRGDDRRDSTGRRKERKSNGAKYVNDNNNNRRREQRRRSDRRGSSKAKHDRYDPYAKRNSRRDEGRGYDRQKPSGERDLLEKREPSFRRKMAGKEVADRRPQGGRQSPKNNDQRQSGYNDGYRHNDNRRRGKRDTIDCGPEFSDLSISGNTSPAFNFQDLIDTYDDHFPKRVYGTKSIKNYDPRANVSRRTRRVPRKYDEYAEKRKPWDDWGGYGDEEEKRDDFKHEDGRERRKSRKRKGDEKKSSSEVRYLDKGALEVLRNKIKFTDYEDLPEEHKNWLKQRGMLNAVRDRAYEESANKDWNDGRRREKSRKSKYDDNYWREDSSRSERDRDRSTKKRKSKSKKSRGRNGGGYRSSGTGYNEFASYEDYLRSYANHRKDRSWKSKKKSRRGKRSAGGDYKSDSSSNHHHYAPVIVTDERDGEGRLTEEAAARYNKKFIRELEDEPTGSDYDDTAGRVRRTYGSAGSVRQTHGSTGRVRQTYGSTGRVRQTYGSTGRVRETYDDDDAGDDRDDGSTNKKTRGYEVQFADEMKKKYGNLRTSSGEYKKYYGSNFNERAWEKGKPRRKSKKRKSGKRKSGKRKSVKRKSSKRKSRTRTSWSGSDSWGRGRTSSYEPKPSRMVNVYDHVHGKFYRTPGWKRKKRDVSTDGPKRFANLNLVDPSRMVPWNLGSNHHSSRHYRDDDYPGHHSSRHSSHRSSHHSGHHSGHHSRHHSSHHSRHSSGIHSKHHSDHHSGHHSKHHSEHHSEHHSGHYSERHSGRDHPHSRRHISGYPRGGYSSSFNYFYPFDTRKSVSAEQGYHSRERHSRERDSSESWEKEDSRERDTEPEKEKIAAPKGNPDDYVKIDLKEMRKRRNNRDGRRRQHRRRHHSHPSYDSRYHGSDDNYEYDYSSRPDKDYGQDSKYPQSHQPRRPKDPMSRKQFYGRDDGVIKPLNDSPQQRPKYDDDADSRHFDNYEYDDDPDKKKSNDGKSYYHITNKKRRKTGRRQHRRRWRRKHGKRSRTHDATPKHTHVRGKTTYVDHGTTHHKTQSNKHYDHGSLRYYRVDDETTSSAKNNFVAHTQSKDPGSSHQTAGVKPWRRVATPMVKNNVTEKFAKLILSAKQQLGTLKEILGEDEGPYFTYGQVPDSLENDGGLGDKWVDSRGAPDYDAMPRDYDYGNKETGQHSGEDYYDGEDFLRTRDPGRWKDTDSGENDDSRRQTGEDLLGSLNLLIEKVKAENGNYHKGFISPEKGGRGYESSETPYHDYRTNHRSTSKRHSHHSSSSTSYPDEYVNPYENYPQYPLHAYNAKHYFPSHSSEEESKEIIEASQRHFVKHADPECDSLDGVFPIKSNCAMFYVCMKGKVTGRYMCPRGLTFDGDKGICSSKRIGCD